MRTERIDFIGMTLKNEKGQTYETEAKQLYERDGTPTEYLFVFDTELFYKIKRSLGPVEKLTAVDECGKDYRVIVYPCNYGDYEIQFYKISSECFECSELN